MTDFDPGKLKHKPNEKHTLDEVLKSLQDLIHNDLLHDASPHPAAEATPAPETAGREAPPATEPPGADMPLEAMVASLEQIVTRDLAPGDDSMQGGHSGLLDRSSRRGSTSSIPEVVPSRDTTPSPEGAVADNDEETFAAEPAAETPPPDPETASPPTPDATPTRIAETGGQQTFALDGPATPATDVPAVEQPPEPPEDMAATPDDTVSDTPAGEPEVEEISLDSANLPVLDDPVLDAGPLSTADADGIPVLEDVAAAPPPDDPEAEGAEAGTASSDSVSGVVERVIERLNADRRERGESELDATVLEALRALLRDELRTRSS